MGRLTITLGKRLAMHMNLDETKLKSMVILEDMPLWETQAILNHEFIKIYPRMKKHGTRVLPGCT